MYKDNEPPTSQEKEKTGATTSYVDALTRLLPSQFDYLLSINGIVKSSEIPNELAPLNQRAEAFVRLYAERTKRNLSKLKEQITKQAPALTKQLPDTIELLPEHAEKIPHKNNEEQLSEELNKIANILVRLLPSQFEYLLFFNGIVESSEIPSDLAPLRQRAEAFVRLFNQKNGNWGIIKDYLVQKAPALVKDFPF